MKEFIFVRGKGVDEEYPWMFYQTHWREDKVKRNIKLTYFDYDFEIRGKAFEVKPKIKTWNSINLGGKRITKEPTKGNSYSEKLMQHDINNPDYRGTKSKNIPTSLPSCLLLYDYIKKRPDNSISSLQLFTHGVYNGPILYSEVYEYHNDLNKKYDRYQDRDKRDTEFRLRDFYENNPLSLASDERHKIRRKFTHDSFIKLYGCDYFDGQSGSILRKALRGELEKGFEEYVRTVFYSYPFLLSLLTSKVVWAPPVGYGTNFSSRDSSGKKKTYAGVYPPKKGQHWWDVPVFVDPKNKTLSTLKDWYVNKFKFQIDSVGFVGYDWVKMKEFLDRHPDLKLDVTFSSKKKTTNNGSL